VPLEFVRGASTSRTRARGASVAAAKFKVALHELSGKGRRLCDLILTDQHSLESWRRRRVGEGPLSLQQTPWIRGSTERHGPTCSFNSPSAIQNAARSSSADYRMARDAHPWWESRPHRRAAEGNENFFLAGCNFAPRNRGSREAHGERPRPNRGAGNIRPSPISHRVISDGRGANKPWPAGMPDQ